MHSQSVWLLLLLLLAAIIAPYRSASLWLPPRVFDIDRESIDTMFSRIRKGRFVEVNQTTQLENENDLDPLIREKKSSSAKDYQSSTTETPPHTLSTTQKPAKRFAIDDDNHLLASNIVATTVIHNATRRPLPKLQPLQPFGELMAATSYGAAEPSNHVPEPERCFDGEPLLSNPDVCTDYYPSELVSSGVVLQGTDCNAGALWEYYDCASMSSGSEPLLALDLASQHACQVTPPYTNICQAQPDDYT